MKIDAAGMSYTELNERIRAEADNGVSELVLDNILGQRYIGTGLTREMRIVVNGIPGNDLACFMAGPAITVNGNAQDGVANTMSSGRIAIHGHAGDVLGYSMRGGKVFVRDSAGYRVGIHMKEYADRVPVIVIGGTARDYLGEYMAGGTLVLLGNGCSEGESPAGDFLATGMHGGEIFIRGTVKEHCLGREVGTVEISDPDWERLRACIEEYSAEFGIDPERYAREQFTRLVAVSHRPYGRIYVY